MKISIKYKRDGYSYPQKNLDTDKMYAWNGHVFRKLNGWEELTICMEHNKPIMVLSDEAEEAGGYVNAERVHKYVEFVINPSSIAIVFPVKQGDKVTEKSKAFPPDEAVRKEKELKAMKHLDQYLQAEERLNKSLEDDGIELSDLVTEYGDSNYVGSTNKDGITS